MIHDIKHKKENEQSKQSTSNIINPPNDQKPSENQNKIIDLEKEYMKDMKQQDNKTQKALGLIPWYVDNLYYSQLFDIDPKKAEELSKKDMTFLEKYYHIPTEDKDGNFIDVLAVVRSDYGIPDFDAIIKRKKPYKPLTIGPQNIDYANIDYVKARLEEIKKGIPANKSTIKKPIIPEDYAKNYKNYKNTYKQFNIISKRFRKKFTAHRSRDDNKSKDIRAIIKQNKEEKKRALMINELMKTASKFDLRVANDLSTKDLQKQFSIYTQPRGLSTTKTKEESASKALEILFDDPIPENKYKYLIGKYNKQQLDELLWFTVMDRRGCLVEEVEGSEFLGFPPKETPGYDKDDDYDIKSIPDSSDDITNILNKQTNKDMQYNKKKELILKEYKKQNGIELSSKFTLSSLQYYMDALKRQTYTSLKTKTDLINNILMTTLGYFDANAEHELKKYSVNTLQDFLFSVLKNKPTGTIMENESKILFPIPKKTIKYSPTMGRDLMIKEIRETSYLLNPQKMSDAQIISRFKTTNTDKTNRIKTINDKEDLVLFILTYKLKSVPRHLFNIIHNYEIQDIKELLYNVLIGKTGGRIYKYEGINFI